MGRRDLRHGEDDPLAFDPVVDGDLQRFAGVGVDRAGAAVANAIYNAMGVRLRD